MAITAARINPTKAMRTEAATERGASVDLQHGGATEAILGIAQTAASKLNSTQLIQRTGREISTLD